MACCRRGHRNILFFCITNQIFSTFEIPRAPWCDDLEVGLERHECEFKAHLVVTFACRPVSDRIGAFFFGDFYLTLGN